MYCVLKFNSKCPGGIVVVNPTIRDDWREMEKYTIEEALVIINAKNIKERQKQRVRRREAMKRLWFSLIALAMSIVSPFIMGRDVVTGTYDFTFSAITIICFAFILISKVHEYRTKEVVRTC